MPKRTLAKSPDASKYEEVSKLIRETREAHKIAQEPLSLKLGESKNFIQNIEYTLRRVDVVEFYRIAKELGIDPVEFYTAYIRRIES